MMISKAPIGSDVPALRRSPISKYESERARLQKSIN
jgi:hypothetical protein